MSHNYFFDLHRFIENRLQAARLCFAQDNSILEQMRLKGQITSLIDFLAFLDRNFQHKLPKRLHRSFPCKPEAQAMPAMD